MPRFRGCSMESPRYLTFSPTPLPHVSARISWGGKLATAAAAAYRAGGRLVLCVPASSRNPLAALAPAGILWVRPVAAAQLYAVRWTIRSCHGRRRAAEFLGATAGMHQATARFLLKCGSTAICASAEIRDAPSDALGGARPIITTPDARLCEGSAARISK